jgi:threonine/homoserine/homoserine lactone efflux protein
MSMEHYISFLVIAILTITSPGPAILVAINNGLKHNMKAVFFSTLGNALGLLVLAVASILGVSMLFKISAIFYIIFKTIGAFYLIYLGIKQIIGSNKTLKLNCSNIGSKDYFKLFKTAFLVAVTNPKPIIFFSTVMPLFINYNESTNMQFALLIATFIAISFASLSTYGFIANKSTMWFSDAKKLKRFFTFSGITFIFMGIAMLFTPNQVRAR